ncbi:MAG: SPOR domain-containing protein [Gammaproteobacteria bacterium]|nr:SPOR domain-containing protein [Gammaproteobacteria bacterium]
MKLPLRLLLAALLALPLSLNADFETAARLYRNNNYPAAFEEFMALAEDGDARAQTVIAMMHKYGEAVPQDPQAAFDWYLKAAKSGYAPAMFNVGEMYRTGRGVEVDRRHAIDWLTRAAAKGFERANDSLAKLNAAPATSDERADPTVPWSRDWDFRLPNTIRFPSPDEDAPVIEPNAVYRAQLGAMTTRAAANRLWRVLSEGYPSLFDGLQPTVLMAEYDQRRIYRVRAGPFEDRRAAKAFCERLKRAEPRAECQPVQ